MRPFLLPLVCTTSLNVNRTVPTGLKNTGDEGLQNLEETEAAHQILKKGYSPGFYMLCDRFQPSMVIKCPSI